MRRYIKKQLLEIINSIGTVLAVIERLISQGKLIEITNYLADMQDSFIGVGNVCEAQIGEGCAPVKCLEEACEILWQMNECCQENNKKAAETLLRKLVNKLKQFRTELGAVKEEWVAVFFPYKAAMWDSLYGLYKDCAADASCTTYVVPIPYFEKKKDGSMGEMHYEFDEYDSELPLAKYDEIKYSELHPEVAYIHNPYDDCNFVTSVHPYFYSKNIKTFADELIYTPYFIHRDDLVQDHFVIVPAVVNADLVYLQSEKVKEQYIDILKENDLGALNMDKFKVKASSKLMDAVDRDDSIPDEWKKLIYNGGKRKKVIFFNTHINDLMESRYEEFFKKLVDVFDTFKDSPEVVVLWRPHPLSLETIRSMNPGVEKEYLDLVKKYKDEQIGIYDDTSDLHRSVDVSDAYYGANSSVVEMFVAQKKPVMLMNTKVLSK